MSKRSNFLARSTQTSWMFALESTPKPNPQKLRGESPGYTTQCGCPSRTGGAASAGASGPQASTRRLRTPPRAPRDFEASWAVWKPLCPKPRFIRSRFGFLTFFCVGCTHFRRKLLLQDDFWAVLVFKKTNHPILHNRPAMDQPQLL